LTPWEQFNCIKVGPPGWNLPVPMLWLMSILPLPFCIGFTLVSIPVHQLRMTALVLLWKIMMQHTASPDADVKGRHANVWLESNDIAYGIVSFSTINFLPSTCPSFFWDVLHPVSSAKMM